MTNAPHQPEKKPGTSLPGADTISYVHHRAARKLSAAQRTPVGRKILNVLRNLAWVLPLTMLVWLYAEREQLDRQPRVAVPITVVSERADRVVNIVNLENDTIFVDIEGTRARIEQARQELTSKQGIQLVVPGSTLTGAQVPFSALEQIATNRIFAERGIVVTSVTPATLTLNIDEVIEGMELRPQVPREVATRLDAVVFDPPAVKVTGPRSVLMNRNAPPEIIAEISEQMLPKVAGDHEIGGIVLRLKEPDERVKITPPTIKAHVRVRSSTTTYMLLSVPVFTMGPQALMDKYQVVFPNGSFMTRVTVVGPEDEINRIKSNGFIPKAVLEIKQEDARERLPRAPFMYILPPEVTVNEDDRLRTIAFELVERSRTE